MSSFRHKPLMVEAHQWKGHQTFQSLPEEFRDALTQRVSSQTGMTSYILSGRLIVKGDWIVRDNDGIFLMEQSLFEERYEVV